jgi:hypothetical protein
MSEAAFGAISVPRLAVAGRPSKLTAELADDLVLLLAAGASSARAARAVGVSERSVTRWLRNGLRERVEQARETSLGEHGRALRGSPRGTDLPRRAGRLEGGGVAARTSLALALGRARKEGSDRNSVLRLLMVDSVTGKAEGDDDLVIPEPRVVVHDRYRPVERLEQRNEPLFALALVGRFGKATTGTPVAVDEPVPIRRSRVLSTVHGAEVCKRVGRGPGQIKGLKRLEARLINNGLLTETRRGPMQAIDVGPTYDEALELYAKELEPWRELIDRVADLFLRFDTNQAEIAGTVHFAATRLVERRDRPATELDVLEAVRQWKIRRKPPLDDGEVARMIRNLNVLGWVDLAPSPDLPLPEDALVDELELQEA